MKIGILTFHKAYNYGACLQAYALQKAVEAYGCDVEIIDYITDSQKDYTALYTKRNGPKSIIKNILLLPFHKKRKLRYKRFNLFYDEEYCVSASSFAFPDELKKIQDYYDKYITGSDQIWNPTKKAEVSPVYFLSFVLNNKKKIAYAPSIGCSEEKDLAPFVKYIEEFHHISCREQRGSQILENLLHEKVPVVIDPTLLIDRQTYFDLIDKKTEKPVRTGPYLFYYSLNGFDKRRENLEILFHLSQRFHLKIISLTPEWPIQTKGIEPVLDAGPAEFLSLIKHAALVCTTSFHGTALSIALERPFYVLEAYSGNDDRKRSLLHFLNLEDRIIKSGNGVLSYCLDYENSHITDRLNELRQRSLKYLEHALFNTEDS